MSIGYRRFTMEAHGILNFFLACDLDEGRLRYWPSVASNSYAPLMFSKNLDERSRAHSIATAMDENAYCIGIELSEENISYLGKLLSTDNIESMRGINDTYMHDKTGGWCYRDGWQIDFYAESDDGSLPCSLRGITYCSFDDDQETFERIERYIELEILHESASSFPYAIKTKMKPRQADDVAAAAILKGIEPIEQILQQGNERLIRSLGKVECNKLLKYNFVDDTFTVFFGNMRTKAYNLCETPNCISIFGKEHVFHSGK